MGTEFIKILTKEHRDALSKARKTYGTTNQILVSNEELCELAAVCAKYPRYSTAEKAQEALYDKALDEVADVLIVLDHIVNIFDLKTPDLKKRVDGKVKRLQGWLNSSDSMEQTTIDRQVPGQTSIPTMNGCSGCIYEESKPLGRCKSCVDQSLFLALIYIHHYVSCTHPPTDLTTGEYMSISCSFVHNSCVQTLFAHTTDI